jgi:hypothetical protein
MMDMPSSTVARIVGVFLLFVSASLGAAEPSSQPTSAPATAPERARALLLEGDKHGARAERREQLESYRAALELDPSLAQDPSFNERFDRHYRPAEPPDPEMASAEYPARFSLLRPRQGRYLGVGASFGPTGIAAISVTSFVIPNLQLSVMADALLPALSVDVKVHILRTHFTPYLGVGGHFSLPVYKPLGALRNPPFGLWRNGYVYFSAGAQYMTDVGFFVDAGVSLVPGFGSVPGRIGDVDVLPNLNLGWAARLGRRR